jgi:uncharacterized membrane protein YhaH (DUF805 family)
MPRDSDKVTLLEGRMRDLRSLDACRHRLEEPDMTFVDAVRICFAKYVDPKGRAGRAEYWWFVLFDLIVSFIVGIIDVIIGSPILGYLVSLAFLLPAIMVSIRRLHDTNRTGWWLLIGLIPVIGWIILIVYYVQQGTPGPNQYGNAPETAVAASY